MTITIILITLIPVLWLIAEFKWNKACRIITGIASIVVIAEVVSLPKRVDLHYTGANYYVCIQEAHQLLAQGKYNDVITEYEIFLSQATNQPNHLTLSSDLSYRLQQINSKSNQRVDPTVKTPVESGKTQGTAGHP